MTTIVINTTLISEFMLKWAEAIGETGFYIILLCVGIYFCCASIQLLRMKIG